MALEVKQHGKSNTAADEGVLLGCNSFSQTRLIGLFDDCMLTTGISRSNE